MFSCVKDPHSWMWWLIAIIPATWETETGRMVVRDQPRQKLARPYLNK